MFISTTPAETDRKSTRLNSSHLGISYAVFCLQPEQDWQRDAFSMGIGVVLGLVVASQVLGLFFNDPATTEIYTLSLHDALPICFLTIPSFQSCIRLTSTRTPSARIPIDRKSTRLNSSHLGISYAVFCLKKT